MSQLKTSPVQAETEAVNEVTFKPGVQADVVQKTFTQKLLRLIYVLFIIAFVICLAVIVAIVADHYYYQDRIYPGVMIENYDVGGKTMDEVEDLFKNKLNTELNNKYIHFLNYDNNNEELMSVTFDEAGLAAGMDDAISRAYEPGRLSTGFGLTYGDPALRYELHEEGEILYLELSIDNDRITEVLAAIDEIIRIAPVDAYAEVRNGRVHIIEDIPGVQLEYDKTIASVYELWEDTLWGRDNHIPFNITIDTKPWIADLTASDLREINISTVISSFSTDLGGSDYNRRHNIKLAADKVHNFFFMPGETFSFNEVVGHANAAAGYLPAPIIVRGEFVQGVGGGICQVSSTLYNVVLNTGMKIEERHPHSQPVGYVPAGRDATISYPYLDLKFSNSRSYPLIITTNISGNRITVNFYGPG